MAPWVFEHVGCKTLFTEAEVGRRSVPSQSLKETSLASPDVQFASCLQQTFRRGPAPLKSSRVKLDQRPGRSRPSSCVSGPKSGFSWTNVAQIQSLSLGAIGRATEVQQTKAAPTFAHEGQGLVQ